MVGRSKKDDTKRKKDIERKIKLQSELSQLRAERSKHRNYIKNNNRYSHQSYKCHVFYILLIINI